MASKTVLIADDDRAHLEMLALRFKSVGFRVLTAVDGLEALMTVMRESPDLLVLDIDMPASDGFSVAERLLRDTRIRPIPVIFCTGSADAAMLERCKSIGAHYVIKGAEAWPQLLAIVGQVIDFGTGAPPVASADSAVTEAPAAMLPKVLCVDDDADVLRVLQIRLRACGIDALTASSAMQALWVAIKELPDIVVTDYFMPEGTGEYLIGRLRAVPALRNVPVIVVTSASTDNKRDFALERRFLGEYGAAGFLTKPLNFDALLDTLARHIQFDDRVWRAARKLRRP